MLSLGEEYMKGEEQAIRLVGSHYANKAARQHVAKERARTAVSPECLAVLETYNNSLPASAERQRNLADLRKPGTLVVVTGQQVGLFLGPLFTYYKVLSCVLTAAAIEKETGVRTVPLFWLQSEDHDFFEINHCIVPDPESLSLRLAVTGDATLSDRISVKYRPLGANVDAQVGLLRTKLGQIPQAEAMLELLATHYRASHSFPDAFAATLSALFSKEGLVFFDPRAAGVANIIRPILNTAFQAYEEIYHLLEAQTAAIVDAGFLAQVHLRKHSPLFFFHEQSDGPRFRLEKHGEQWTLIGSSRTLSPEQLKEALEHTPALFSSSALLRPIIQDYLFPTVAYIAGPAEIGYFAQLSPLYEFFGVGKPLIIPRASFSLIDSKSASWLKELGLTVEDFFRPEEELRRKRAKITSSSKDSPEFVQSMALASIEQGLLKMRLVFEKCDATLVAALEKSGEKMFNQVQLLTKRYERALAEKDQTYENRIVRLRHLLLPEGKDQERYFAAIYYLCRYGAEFKDMLSSAFRPYQGERKDVFLR